MNPILKSPLPAGEGVGDEGLTASFGVSRPTGRATAVADVTRRPSSGAHAPPSPIGRRGNVDGSTAADRIAAIEFPRPFNTPPASRTVLPDPVQRCATLHPSPSQERRLGTQALMRRRGPVERDCPGRNPGVRGVSGRLARRGPRDWDLLSNRDRRSRAHKHPGARPPAEETVPPGARVNRPGRRQAGCRKLHSARNAKAGRIRFRAPGPCAAHLSMSSAPRARGALPCPLNSCVRRARL